MKRYTVYSFKRDNHYRFGIYDNKFNREVNLIFYTQKDAEDYADRLNLPILRPYKVR